MAVACRLRSSRVHAAMFFFEWDVWWQLAHTGRLPSGIVVNFVPKKCVIAFSVCHLTGMLGSSESHAESIGGTLKWFAKSLGTGLVVESIMLRSAGFSC